MIISITLDTFVSSGLGGLSFNVNQISTTRLDLISEFEMFMQ